MEQDLLSVTEVVQRIKEGRRMLLAADATLLAQLPEGRWIGGTTPYFMTASGGTFSRYDIFVMEIPPWFGDISIHYYEESQLDSVYQDLSADSIGLIMIPAMSRAHYRFALEVTDFPEFGKCPLAGWVTGMALNPIGSEKPTIFNGLNGEAYADGVIVLQVHLSPGFSADIDIINIFQQGDGDIITFPENGFTAGDVRINGKPGNLVDYIFQQGIDIRLPLIADHGRGMINISFKNMDVDRRRVSFYAPVFREISYLHARPVANYIQEFLSRMPDKETARKESGIPVFACNCILNYLFSELDGKRITDMVGPFTFGEIAGQLLNQTMVRLLVYPPETVP